MASPGPFATLLASTAATATGNGSAVALDSFNRQYRHGLIFVLDVTAAARAVGDTLDVFVGSLLDGTNWLDVVHFTQVLGNGGAVRYVSKITPYLGQAEFSYGATLAAASIRQILSDQLRVRWTIAGATPNFTFNVKLVIL